MDNKDEDYIQFGYWLTKASGDDGMSYTDASGFYDGMMEYGKEGNSLIVHEVEGSAKYAGPAAGLYVKKSFSPAGNAVPTSSGQFTADAMVTAYFGGINVAQSKHFMVMGQVTNFMDDGMEIDPSWMLTLNQMLDGMDTGRRPHFFSDMKEKGAIRGTFYGPTVMMEDDDSTPDVDEGKLYALPTGLGINFNGHFTNGHVVGAGGLTMMTE